VQVVNHVFFFKKKDLRVLVLTSLVLFSLTVIPQNAFATQFGRPSADTTINDWTDQSAGTTNIYTGIDEVTASDTDYVRGATKGTALYETLLTSMTDPVSSSGHTFNYRYQKSASAGVILTFQVCLFQGGTSIACDAQDTNVPNGWVDGTYTLSAGEADSITNYADLRLVMTPGTSGGGAGRWVQVSFAELQIPDASGHAPVTVTDTFTFSESEISNHGFTQSGTDTFAFVETTNVIENHVAFGLDTFSFAETDNTVKKYVRSAIDVFPFVETTDELQLKVRSGIDTFAFVETTDVLVSNLEFGLDTFNFVENTDSIGHYIQSGTDVLAFVETFSAPLGFTASATDVFVFVEVGDAVKTVNRSGTDTFSFVETVDSIKNSIVFGLDTFNFVDSGVKTSDRVESDIFAFVETTDISQLKVRSGTDTFAFVESNNIKQYYVRSGLDTFNFVDTGIIGNTRTATDTFNFVDSTLEVKPFSPGGTYITFKVAPADTTHVGGVFSFDCGVGFYVRGVTTTGELICEALP